MTTIDDIRNDYNAEKSKWSPSFGPVKAIHALLAEIDRLLIIIGKQATEVGGLQAEIARLTSERAPTTYPDHYDPQAIARAIATLGEGETDADAQQQLRGLSLLNLLNADKPVPVYAPSAAPQPVASDTEWCAGLPLEGRPAFRLNRYAFGNDGAVVVDGSPEYTAEPPVNPTPTPERYKTKPISQRYAKRQLTRDKGRYSDMRKCEVCGTFVGDDYCSDRRVDDVWDDTGICLCEPCCLKADAMDDDAAFAFLTGKPAPTPAPASDDEPRLTLTAAKHLKNGDRIGKYVAGKYAPYGKVDRVDIDGQIAVVIVDSGADLFHYRKSIGDVWYVEPKDDEAPASEIPHYWVIDNPLRLEPEDSLDTLTGPFTLEDARKELDRIVKLRTPVKEYWSVKEGHVIVCNAEAQPQPKAPASAAVLPGYRPFAGLPVRCPQCRGMHTNWQIRDTRNGRESWACNECGAITKHADMGFSDEKPASAAAKLVKLTKAQRELLSFLASSTESVELYGAQYKSIHKLITVGYAEQNFNKFRHFRITDAGRAALKASGK